MPFCRPDPFTSLMVSDGNPRLEQLHADRLERLVADVGLDLLHAGTSLGVDAIAAVAGCRATRRDRTVAHELGGRDELLGVPVHAVLGDVETGLFLLRGTRRP